MRQVERAEAAARARIHFAHRTRLHTFSEVQENHRRL
jgi:hypothetical protein